MSNPKSLIVLALAMILGASAVLLFREPVKRKPRTEPVVEDARGDDARPSGSRTPAGPQPRSEPRPARAGADRVCADLNARAVEKLEAGAHQEAIELFAQARSRCPGEKVIAHNLAEAYARRAGEETAPDEALELLRLAIELAPDRADLASRAAGLEKLAKSEEGLWKDESEHFTLAFDGDRSELLWQSFEITNALETAYADLGDLFGFHPVEGGRAKIKVVLYGKDAFHEATGIGHWAGGLYDGTVRVPVGEMGRETTQLVRVLRHELSHAFVHSAGGREVPGWLNEGLAQLHEHTDASARAAAVTAARTRVAKEGAIPLEELAGSLGAQKDESRIGLAYAQGLAFTGWIARTWGERVPFEMVAACKDGSTAAAGFEARTGRALADAFDDFLRD